MRKVHERSLHHCFGKIISKTHTSATSERNCLISKILIYGSDLESAFLDSNVITRSNFLSNLKTYFPRYSQAFFLGMGFEFRKHNGFLRADFHSRCNSIRCNSQLFAMHMMNNSCSESLVHQLVTSVS